MRQDVCGNRSKFENREPKTRACRRLTRTVLARKLRLRRAGFYPGACPNNEPNQFPFTAYLEQTVTGTRLDIVKSSFME